MARGGQQGDPTDWVTRAADDAIRHAGGEDRVITCSSGASPSGPVHLGNLREFLTVHFVADELRRRGVPSATCTCWDDYDRFRKVPGGRRPVLGRAHRPAAVGRPRPVGVPRRPGPSTSRPRCARRCTSSAWRWRRSPRPSATRRGAYREQVLRAVRHRDDIDAVLARYRTKQPAPESDQEAEELADSVADDEDVDTEAGAGLERFPFKPYCRECGRDTTHITAYDDETTDLSYTCQSCGFTGVTNLATQDEGKLVWKVDWPMRWAFEKVDFEPAGIDHATPGLVVHRRPRAGRDVFGMPRPAWFGYGFVGFAGVQKMSSSTGGVPTAADALKVMEAPILRWLYVRRQPQADVQHRLRPRDGPAVRRVGRARPQGRRPGEARRRGAGLRAGRRDRHRRRAARPAGRRTVPHAVLGRRRDRRLRRADQPGDRARRPRALLGDRPRAPAVAGDGVDRRVRAAGGPDDRPGRARHRAAVVAVRARGALAGSARSTGSPRCPTSSTSRR